MSFPWAAFTIDKRQESGMSGDGGSVEKMLTRLDEDMRLLFYFDFETGNRVSYRKGAYRLRGV